MIPKQTNKQQQQQNKQINKYMDLNTVSTPQLRWKVFVMQKKK